MKTMFCPVCNASSYFLLRHPDTELYRCPQCDHCFADINTIDVPEEYGSEYYEITHRNWFNNSNKALYKAICNYITEFNNCASVIDVGCGKANFLKFLHTETPRLSLVGIDLSYNEPTEGIELLQGDIFTADVKKQFDVVTSLAVIEHIHEVRTFIQKTNDLCVPGGLIIIMTLNERSILYELSRLLNKIGFKAPFVRLYNKHHVNHFNISSLRKLVKENNLSVIKTLHHNTELAAVDFSSSNTLAATVFRIGVWITFMIGILTKRTYLQTIICKKEG